jgi:hypothetical protein
VPSWDVRGGMFCAHRRDDLGRGPVQIKKRHSRSPARSPRPARLPKLTRLPKLEGLFKDW